MQKTSVCTTVSFHSLSHQQLSLLQDQLNNGLPLCVDLLNGKRRVSERVRERKRDRREGDRKKNAPLTNVQ